MFCRRRATGHGSAVCSSARAVCIALVAVPTPTPSSPPGALETGRSWSPPAAAAAFLRDRVEHGTVGEAFVTAGIEGMAVVACFFVLGPALGLWRR